MVDQKDYPYWGSKGCQLAEPIENIVLCWLRACVYVFSTKDYNGLDRSKAPAIIGLGRTLILPDYGCFLPGRRLWIEGKAKSHPLDWHIDRPSGRHLYHGIDTYLLHSYRSVAALTATLVDLVLYEEDSGLFLYMAHLLQVKPHVLCTTEIRGGPKNGSHMTNFRREWFTPFSVEVTSKNGRDIATDPLSSVRARSVEHLNKSDDVAGDDDKVLIGGKLKLREEG